MPDTTLMLKIHHYLEQLRQGDAAIRAEAVNGLITLYYERLHSLAEHMLRSFPRVRRQIDAEELLNEAYARIRQTLHAVTPETPKHFCNLMALQLRRELLDLAAKMRRREQGIAVLDGQALGPAGTNAPVVDQAQSTHDPAGPLATWTEIHAFFDGLSAEERDVVDLVYYHGMTYPEAGEKLNLPPHRIKRIWMSVRRRLGKLLDDPEANGHFP